MSETEIRRLLTPDQGLPADRREAIEERVVSSLGSEVSVSSAQRRRFRRLVPVLAEAVLLAAAGVAGALGLFPQQSREVLDEIGCRNPDSVEEMVARAEAADGRTFQFWTTKATENAPQTVSSS